MGKKLRQQRRGKGSNVYKKLPNTFNISVNYPNIEKSGEVVGLFNTVGHTPPIMVITYDDFSKGELLAPEGISIGDKIHIMKDYSLGSVKRLFEIPEGIPIYNIERNRGDGGKLVRAAGNFAFITARLGNKALVKMPSKKSVSFDMNCRAQLGVVAGGGFLEQPILKAGKNHYIKHSLNRTWPVNRGVKMNPVDHPFGGKQHHKGKSSMTSRNAPPGRKVGHIAARRIGRKKR